jgi:photosystem II stability/assembly factor-like uncharacterized protein
MKATRTLLIISFVATSFALLWDFTPAVSSNNSPHSAKILNTKARLLKTRTAAAAREANTNVYEPLPEPTVPVEGGDDEDPDLPPGLSGLIDKGEYLRARGDYIDMLRGQTFEGADAARQKAIAQMDKQEALTVKARSNFKSANNITDWTFIGPNPIPLGQTTTTRVPVSGRTIAIAVHPTDPNTVYVGTAQGGLYKSINGGTNWTKLFDFQLESLAIGAITIDPADSNIVFVGTGENGQSADSSLGRGLYIIRNANSGSPTLTGPFRLDGSNNDVFSGRAIGRILVNPADHNTIFLCTANATGGNPNTTTVLQPPRGIYRSTNAQSANPTFSQIQITGVPTPNDRSVIDLEMDPANPNLMLATVIGVTGDGGIYRTANALDPTPTFTRTLTLANSGNFRAELTATRTTGGVTTFYTATGEIATGCGATTAGALRRSTDLGLTWSTPMATGFCGGQCFYDIAVAVTNDNQTIHLGGAAGNGGANPCTSSVMKRSTNGGTTFAANAANLHADEHALAIAPSNQQVVYTGSDGGIWRSTNNGTTWVSLNNIDFSATQFQGVAVHPFDRNFLIGGTQDNGTICFSNTGAVSHCRDGDGGYAIIDTNALDTFNVTSYHTFFNQTNNQIAFERAVNMTADVNGQLTGWAANARGCLGGSATNGIRCADNTLFYAPMAQGPGNPNTLYFGTDRLYRSANRGDLMPAVSQGPLVPTPLPTSTSGVVITTIGISPQDDKVRIVGMRDGHVFATTTGSSTLTDVTGANFPAPNPLDPTRNTIGKAIIDPNNKYTAYISFTSFSPPAGQQIFKTTNLNAAVPTWTPSSTGIPQVPVSSLAIDPQDSNSIYAATDIGVYRSSDGGATWLPLGTGLPRVAVFDLKISDVQRYLRIATHGRGIWEIGLPGNQTGVMRNGSIALTAEHCIPGNGVIDAGEDVTVNFTVQNLAAAPAATTDLVVTLLTTGSVTFPSAPVHYGSIAPGSSGSGSFTFSNNASCGDTITLTFHLQDGPANLGDISIPYTLGALQNSAPAFTENFDGVAAPALPTGWTTARSSTAAGSAALWVTSTTSANTPPNSAFGAGGTVASDSSLTSPVIAIPNAPSVGGHAGVNLDFQVSYNTEYGFDGGRVEISINGGAFQEMTAAGGVFELGGYNAVIVNTDSIFTGSPAWSGNSGGFIPVRINLPPAAFGQNVQLRWHDAHDSGGNPTGGGVRIDSLSIYATTRICCGGACVLTCPTNITTPNDPGVCGAAVTFATASETGNCGGTITADYTSGSTFPVGTTTVTQTDTKLDGSTATCSFDITVNDTEFPVVSNPTMNPSTLWPPNHQMVDVAVNYTATDNCPGLNCVLTVTSSEPINGLGDGDTAPDWIVVSDHLVKLRAERSGKGKGRTYTVTTTCTDASGNVTTKTSTLFIPANQKGALFPSATPSTPLNATGGVQGTIGKQLFAPGTGWFVVPPGSYRLNPALSGKAEFKIDAPASDHKGQAPLSFSVGSLKFRSTDYEYAELTDSSGEFRGSGKLNGEDGYEFVLTVGGVQQSTDEHSDNSRIKIWDKSGAVVFDSESNGSSGVKAPAGIKQANRSTLKN